MTPKVYVNEARTVMVQDWGGGMLTVATRDHPDGVWGPPVAVVLEAAHAL